MRKCLIMVLLLVFSASLFGQTRVLKENVDTINHLANEDSSHFGLNKRHFVSTYLGVGLPINQYQSGRHQLRGVYFDFGMYYKLKLGSIVSVVCDVSYSRIMNSFYFGDELTTPEEPVYRFRRVLFGMGNSGLGLRFNLDANRGNTLGKYIEIKAKGGLLASMVMKSRAEVTNAGYSFIRNDKSRIKNINDRLAIGADLLIGTGGVALKLSYIANAEVLPYAFFSEKLALPTYSIGIQFGLSS